MVGFVGVHVGAGQHSESREANYRELLQKACEEGISLVKKGKSAAEVTSYLTTILEDCEITNAGYGSNLTECGTVECDASLMDGTTLQFGAVGAVSGIKNPILIAKKLIDVQEQGYLTLGRVPPCFLAGEGARKWAERHGISVSTNLISKKSRNLYKHYKRKLEECEKDSIKKAKFSDDQEKCASMEDEDDGVSDTVGVVCLDSCGRLASSVSSGGIALKQLGRVGQAAVFGCGCWSQNASESGHPGVAVSTSGCGEHLMRTTLAKQVASSLLAAECGVVGVRKTLQEDFVGSSFLHDIPQKQGGVIALLYDKSHEHGEFIWGHTTASMGIGCMSETDKKAKTWLSRMPEGCQNGHSVLVEGSTFSFPVSNKQQKFCKPGRFTVSLTSQHSPLDTNKMTEQPNSCISTNSSNILQNWEAKV